MSRKDWIHIGNNLPKSTETKEQRIKRMQKFDKEIEKLDRANKK